MNPLRESCSAAQINEDGSIYRFLFWLGGRAREDARGPAEEVECWNELFTCWL